MLPRKRAREGVAKLVEKDLVEDSQEIKIDDFSVGRGGGYGARVKV